MPGAVTGTLTIDDLIASQSGRINTFADAVAAIQDGNTYINVHSTDFSSGEIRGQIEMVP